MKDNKECRIAAVRDRSGKHTCQVRNVKSVTGKVVTKDDGANTLAC